LASTEHRVLPPAGLFNQNSFAAVLSAAPSIVPFSASWSLRGRTRLSVDCLRPKKLDHRVPTDVADADCGSPLASLDLVIMPPLEPLVPDARSVVSSPLAVEIDSALVCRVASGLEWHPIAAIAVNSGAAANRLWNRAVNEGNRGMGQGEWDQPNRTLRPRAVLFIPRPWPPTRGFWPFSRGVIARNAG
jgi:hypothetical protein